jgi:hypothetical protein
MGMAMETGMEMGTATGAVNIGQSLVFKIDYELTLV